MLPATEPDRLDLAIAENIWAYGKRFRFIADAIGKHCGLSPNTRILDVGCGNGSQVAIPLAQLGLEVTGIDTDLRSIQQAQQYSSTLPNTQFRTGLVSDLEAPPFHCVILSEVLEHVEHPARLLRESLSHVRNRGIVIVTVPNGYGEFECDSWIYRTLRLDRAAAWASRRKKPYAYFNATGDLPSTENHDCGHIQFFTLGRLCKMFSDEGLEIVARRGSCLACGPLAVHTLGHVPGFIRWNQSIIDALPIQFACGWYFVLRRTTQ